MTNDNQPTVRTVIVPPGRHAVRFRCDPPFGYSPKDSRRLVFFLSQFELTAVSIE